MDSAPPGIAQGRRARAGQAGSRSVVLSLRWYLLALTAAVMLPLLILAWVEARDAMAARRSESQLEMQLLLASGSNSVEQGLDALIGTARLLAKSPSLAARDLTAFRQEADELASTRQVDVVLRDPSGSQVMATRVPRGSAPPTLPPEDRQARPALAEAGAYVSDVYTSGMTHPFLTRVIVPAKLGSGPGAQPGFEVEVAFTAETVSSWVNGGVLPPHWFISVLGRNGIVVARHPNPGQYVGRGTATDSFGPPGDGHAAAWQGFALDGKPLTGVYRRLASGWTVVVGAPDAILNQPARTALLWLIAAAVPLILGGLVSSVLVARRINGSVARLERTARALGEGHPVTPQPLPVRDLAFVQEALLAASQDIAARRLTEKTLLGHVQEGRDLLQAVVDGSSDLIFARDRADRLVLINQASAALFGFSDPAEAVGRVMDSDTPHAAAALAAAEPGRIAAAGDRMFEVSHSALRNEAGEAIGTISIARDVTERVAANAKLQRLQSDLARAGRLSAVAAMGAGLAHELHQPLSAAANFLAVAMRRLSSSLAQSPEIVAPIAEAMGEASAQVLRTGEIVKRLRGFIGEAAMQPTGLAPLIREAADAAWRHSGHAPGRLHLQLDEALQALVDTVSIQQVVSNLVRNAAEAVADGGDVWIVLELSDGGAAMVSVMDSGPGIDPQAAERLFDVFGGSAKEGGLGVGLAICRTIVAAHGGWIMAANHAGGGAAFMVTLPPLPPTLAVSPAGERQAA